jgi:type I restriction enzyme S subunit
MRTDSVAFTDVVADVVDNRGRTCPTAVSGIPLIATNCVRNDRLYPATDNVRFVSDETYSTWFRGHPKPGDLIFVLKGSPGRVCLAPDPVDFCIAQDMVAVRANPERVDPKFLFALLRSEVIQQQIAQLHVGSLIPHFKKGDFDKLRLELPSRPVQDFVGRIYFELSAKIELNRRINETLECTAQSLFNERFGAAIANAALGYLVDIERNGVSPQDHTDEWFDHYSLPAFDEGRRPVRERGSDVKSNKFVVTPDCVLLSKLNPSIPRVWLPRVTKDRRSIASTEFLVLRPTATSSAEYLNCLLRCDAVREHLVGLASGTSNSHQRVRPDDLLATPVHVPNARTLDEFTNATQPMFERVNANLAESATLAAMRDTLLPKLLSGELRVRPADARS